MNRVQYRRWKDFAIRMSLKGWPVRQVMGKTHQAIVIPAVVDFFHEMEWDYSSDIIRMESWDDTRTDHSKKDPYGHSLHGPYVCDIVSEMLSEYNPYYWDSEEYDKAYESWDDKWGGRIRACIRAGMDLAVEQSGGVLGFTKADIEHMYPEGVPKWIQKGWIKGNGEERPVMWEAISKTEGMWL